MKCVMVMFDSLNRHMLPSYNAETWVHAPNFHRLAQRTATFETSYVCSMPCMPARRDLHTGRPNFLHTSWGPIEPYDDSMPAMLTEAGVLTHLTTDHYHYWEDGGATYHNRYGSCDFVRGQEGDLWIGQCAEPHIPRNMNEKGRRQDWVNREYMRREEDQPQSLTFRAGLDFIDRNHAHDRWFLQIECFDPHEPFFTHRKYRDLYDDDPVGMPLFDWPPYWKVTQTPAEVEACRRNYAALVSKCDASLGDVLDAFDRHDLWKDTMLVVWTDHGFLLGEHGWWAKNNPPMYRELSNTPFFVWDPRSPESAGQRRQALVQPSIDLGPTLLRFFGVEPTERMLGHDLAPVIRSDAAVREYAIFGYHGARLNVTDGRYVYMRNPVREDNGPLDTYTLMPTTMRGFKPKLETAELAPPFTFTKNMPLLRIRNAVGDGAMKADPDHLLFDLEVEPGQERSLSDEAVEQRMCAAALRLMEACEAPREQYVRLGLEAVAAG